MKLTSEVAIRSIEFHKILSKYILQNFK